MPGHHSARPAWNKGRRYPAVDEIVAVMRCAGSTPYGLRTRALIVLLWRAGVRISEALAPRERDVDRSTGAALVRRGKGGKRRQIGMDRWGWQQIELWLDRRVELPVGALVSAIDGPTAERPWSPSAVRATLRHLAAVAAVRRRFAPHQRRHAHAVEMARERRPALTVLVQRSGR